MGEIGWDIWQLEILDNYILGYEMFNSQEELADAIGKSFNSVKVKLSRRRSEIEIDKGCRELTFEEYKFFLSNRFDKTADYIAKHLKMSTDFLLNELDEIDCLETFESFEEDYKDRIMTLDEIKVLTNLLSKGRNSFQIAHILNRPIDRIKEIIKEYEFI